MIMGKEVKDYGAHILQMVGDLATVKQIATDTLAQATRTNGRVTKLEETVATHSAKILLTDAVDAAALVKANWWKDKVGSAFIAILFSIVGGAILLLLQKTEIVNISTATEQQYNEIEAIAD